jgi:hypothetical protein
MSDDALTPAGIEDAPWQTCDKCQSELPVTAYYFDRDAQEPSGFRKTCKVCRKNKEKRVKDLEISAAVEQFDKMALNMLAKASSVRGGANIPHVAECFEQLMYLAGGASGFAQHVWYTFLSAPPGSQQRVKILTLMKDFAVKTTDSGAAKKPLDMMTEEELKIELDRREARILKVAQGTIDVA